MPQRVAVPAAVSEERLRLLRVQLDANPTARAAYRIDPWWRELAEEQGVAAVSPEHIAAGDTLLTGLVATDTLRPEISGDRDGDLGERLARLMRTLAPDTRVVFAEIDRVEGRGGVGNRLAEAVPPVDATLAFWRLGLSPVDVHRTPVRSRHGIWYLVTGVARCTPKVAEHPPLTPRDQTNDAV